MLKELGSENADPLLLMDGFVNDVGKCIGFGRAEGNGKLFEGCLADLSKYWKDQDVLKNPNIDKNEAYHFEHKDIKTLIRNEVNEKHAIIKIEQSDYAKKSLEKYKEKIISRGTRVITRVLSRGSKHQSITTLLSTGHDQGSYRGESKTNLDYNTEGKGVYLGLHYSQTVRFAGDESFNAGPRHTMSLPTVEFSADDDPLTGLQPPLGKYRGVKILSHVIVGHDADDPSQVQNTVEISKRWGWCSWAYGHGDWTKEKNLEWFTDRYRDGEFKCRGTKYVLFPHYPVIYHQKKRFAIIHPDYAEYIIEPKFVIVTLVDE